MRNSILGTVAGLLVGMAGALAYSHFLGDGAMLGDTQAQLDAANAKLAKLNSDKQQLAKQTTGESDQVDALEASNEDLKKRLAAVKAGAPDDQPAAAAPQVSTAQIAGMIMGMMRNGFRSPEQQAFVLKTRLHLTDDQMKQVRVAMDKENQARRDLMRQRFQGGQQDPKAVDAANSVQKTLATILSPDQQIAYQQLQQDEKASRAESSATQTVDQMMPLLQLTDAQKEQAMTALYQQQLSAPDPASLLTDPGAMGRLASQAQTQSAVMSKVLNQDQLALYQQEQQVQSQAMADMQNRRQQRGNNGGNGGNGNGGNGGNPGAGAPGGGVQAATPAAAPAAATPSAVPATDSSAATTNAASATTNSAASSPPPPPGA